jgi:cell filamentation protein
MAGKYNYTYEGVESYCYPGTDVLRNKLGIKDGNVLTTAEREITSLKLIKLYNMPTVENFNFETLCKIHEVIFEDIYEWAGQVRRGDFLSKGNSVFCRGSYVIENAEMIFGNILNENNLAGLNKSKFVERMAYYMGEINALHPFREGNGRTSREFFRQLSLSANYTLDFSKTEKDKLLTADIEAFSGRYEKLMQILEKAIV